MWRMLFQDRLSAEGGRGEVKGGSLSSKTMFLHPGTNDRKGRRRRKHIRAALMGFLGTAASVVVKPLKSNLSFSSFRRCFPHLLPTRYLNFNLDEGLGGELESLLVLVRKC